MANTRMFQIPLVREGFSDPDIGAFEAEPRAEVAPSFKVNPFIDPENGNKMLPMVDDMDSNHPLEFDLKESSKKDLKSKKITPSLAALNIFSENSPAMTSLLTKEEIQRNYRKRALERYQKKGYVRERCFVKSIKYICRKNYANRRLRISGRFVSKEVEEVIIKFVNNFNELKFYC